MTRTQMTDRLSGLIGDGRFRHSLGVEREAVRLAGKYGEDPEKAAVAGLLHDCRKEMPFAEALDVVRRADLDTEIDFTAQPGLIHGFAASLTLDEFGVTDADILNAVRYHTTGRAGMSRLEQIVFLADLTEAGRAYGDAEIMRGLADTSLREGMTYALCRILQKLAGGRRLICRETWEAYQYFVKL